MARRQYGSTLRFSAALAASLAGLIALGAIAPLAAQERQPEVVKLTLHPRAETVPALKYPLLPSALDTQPGDAAPQYMRAFLLQATSQAEEKAQEDLVDWLKTPLAELPLEKVRTVLDRNGPMLRELEIATRREHCHWGLPIREHENPIAILLPNMQRAGDCGRLLALQARLETAEGKHAEALATLRRGYALARHCNEEEVLVSSLVGLAIAHTMTDQLLTLLEQKDAPNLYWSLTDLPSPLIDVRRGLRFEYATFHLMMRDFDEVRHGVLSEARANELIQQFAKKNGKLSEELGADQDAGSFLEKLRAPLAAAWHYAQARENLLACGVPEKEVNAMPKSQVVLREMFVTFERYRDEGFKWFGVPYWQLPENFSQQLEDQLAEAKKKPSLGGVMASLLLPALNAAKQAEVRFERRLAALRCCEALRLHLAASGGKLPATLGEIKGVVIPLNPATGQPFAYRLEGETAILEERGLGAATDRIYEIRAAKP
jgi:hypothetical protein